MYIVCVLLIEHLVFVQNCYWALFQASAIIWAYAFPKSLLGLTACVISYFLVLLSIHVTRMAMTRWHLHGLFPVCIWYVRVLMETL